MLRGVVGHAAFRGSTKQTNVNIAPVWIYVRQPLTDIAKMSAAAVSAERITWTYTRRVIVGVTAASHETRTEVGRNRVRPQSPLIPQQDLKRPGNLYPVTPTYLRKREPNHHRLPSAAHIATSHIAIA